MCCSRNNRRVGRDSERGSALILVLVCLLALAGLVGANVQYAFEAADEARYLAAEYQAEMRADSVFELARGLMLLDADMDADLPTDPWVEPYSTDEFTVTIDPCNARLNLNGVHEHEAIREALRTLLRETDRPADNLETLLDWTDGDRAERIYGSEGALYMNTMPSYKPSNKDLTIIDEVFLISGWKDMDRQWVDDHFTLWTSDPKVGLNFVSEDVFKAYLPEAATYWPAIEEWRRTQGFSNITQLRDAVPALQADLGLYNQLLRKLSLKSYAFRVFVEVHTPLVYMKKRYIVKRPRSQDAKPEFFQAEVLSVRRSAPDNQKGTETKG